MLKRIFAGKGLKVKESPIEMSQELIDLIDAVRSAGKTPTIALGKMLWWKRHAEDTGYTKMAEWIDRVREAYGHLERKRT